MSQKGYEVAPPDRLFAPSDTALQLPGFLVPFKPAEG